MGAATSVRVIDPHGLTTAQRHGDACASCRKSFPRPRVPIGRFPDGRPVLVCDDH
jgi:hypothetical protein